MFKIIKRIVRTIFVMFCFGFSSIGMSQQTNPEILLLYFDGSVQSFNLDSGEYGTRLSLSLASIKTSPDSDILYGLHYPTVSVGFILIDKGKIVEFETENGITNTIYQRENIVNFSKVPNNEQMLITYISDEIQQYSDLVSDTPTFICILEIVDGVCNDIEVPEDQYGIVWHDSEKALIHGHLENNWFIIDLDTATPRQFSIDSDVEILDSADLSFEDEIFVYRSQAPANSEIFGLLNVSTGNFNPYSLDTELQLYQPISTMRLSPNFQYLLFKMGGTSFVFDIDQGLVIAEIQDLHNPQWLTENTIIAQHFTDNRLLPQNIVTYDFESQMQKTIASFDEEVFVTILQK